MEITDKELLAMCNLSNLKMEFADVVKEKQRVPDPNNSGKFIEKILSNHTIYSLLKKEIEGIKERKECIATGIPFDKEKELGAFVRYIGDLDTPENEVQKYYVYFSKEKLIEEASVLLEYYDSYCEFNKSNENIGNDENVGSFLNEWEILVAGDNISLIIYCLKSFYKIIQDTVAEISKELSTEDYNGIKPYFPILNLKDVKKELEKIDLKCYRESIEKQKDNEKSIKTVIKILENPITGTFIDIGVSKSLKRFLIISKAWEKIEGKLGNFIGGFLGSADSEINKQYGEFLIGVLDNFEVINKKSELEIFEKILSKNADKIENNIKKISLIKKFDLTDDGLHFCVLKKKESIVIAIRNDKELHIDEDLNNGNIPKYLTYLEILYKNLKAENPNAEIIFTGSGNAAKLAILYAVYYGESAKTFSKDKPTNIKTIVDFTEKDLKDVSDKLEYLNNQEFVYEIIKYTGSELITYTIPAVPQILRFILFTGNMTLKGLLMKIMSPAVITLFFLGLLGYVSDLMEKIRDAKSILKELEKYKIIENLNIDNTKHYSSEKILGEVNKNNFINGNILYDYKFSEKDNCKVNLFTLLVILIIKYSYDFIYERISQDNTEISFFKTKSGGNTERTVSLKLKIENGKYKKILIGEYITYKNENSFEENSEIYATAFELSSLIFYFYILQTQLKKYSIKETSKVFNYFFEKNIISYSEIISLEVKEQYSVVNRKSGEIEELYAPYLSSKENNPEVKKEENSEEDAAIKEKISDEYTASLLRSCVNASEDFKEKNINEKIENEDYSLITFGLSTPEDRETLNASLFKIVEERGKNIALPEHYESVMKKLRENPKSIEKYYFIKEDKYVKEKGELVIGIFDDEKKEFAPYKMGFAYSNLDKIKVGLSSIPLYFLDKVDVSSISTTKVCSGATLNCSCGTDPKKLMVTSHFSFTDNGNLIATSADKNPISNIGGFGGCKCHNKKPCINYINLSSWEGVSPNNTYKGNNLLLNVSTISCTEGGIITIEDSNCKTKAN